MAQNQWQPAWTANPSAPDLDAFGEASVPAEKTKGDNKTFDGGTLQDPSNVFNNDGSGYDPMGQLKAACKGASHGATESEVGGKY